MYKHLYRKTLPISQNFFGILFAYKSNLLPKVGCRLIGGVSTH